MQTPFFRFVYTDFKTAGIAKGWLIPLIRGFHRRESAPSGGMMTGVTVGIPYANAKWNANGVQVYSSEFRNKNHNLAPQIRFVKKIDGSYYVVEAVCENKYKKLWVQSAYLQKNNGDVTQAPAEGLSANHETKARSAVASPSPDYSVADGNPNVNG